MVEYDGWNVRSEEAFNKRKLLTKQRFIRCTQRAFSKMTGKG